MTNKIQAVLFDLDGVLAETRQLHFEALSLALSDLDLHISFEEHQAIFDGLPTFKKLEMLKDRFNLTPEKAKILNDKKQEYTLQLLKGKIVPNVEHARILDFLKHKSIKVAVCSNTKRDTLNFVLQNLGIMNLLEFSLSNEDVKEPKPSPEIYLSAMKRLNAEPGNTVIIEDSPHGVASAKGSLAKVTEIRSPQDLTLDLIKKLVS